MSEKVHASPTKQFFIHMITRDISLEACILDLVDNCLDGTRKHLTRIGSNSADNQYAGYKAFVSFDGEKFRIKDNCGGIPVADAIDYAFHFGRRPDAPSEGAYSIGLYGIGMKRAIFKIGKIIQISSSTENEGFRVNIDVPAWESRPTDWDFELERTSMATEPGTSIEVSGLNGDIAEELADPVFSTQLRKVMARDYSFFLQKGFEIKLNDLPVQPYEFKLADSEDFRPMKASYSYGEGISYEILAGLAGLPPEDIEKEFRLTEVDYFGWFVACNDRIVLAADKTERTVWGDEDFPVWHPQYNGFMGMVMFRSNDTSKLPWTTTKRDLDLTDPLYRQAVLKMKDATRQWIVYTNSRKDDLVRAKQLENRALPKAVDKLDQQNAMKLPDLGQAERVETARISYSKPRAKALKVAEALGNRNMSNKEIGSQTFDYFFENKVEE